MEKILNFRDLGGIPLKNGRTVKKGCFFRCAAPDSASVDDRRRLNAYGIRTVFDFRDKEEISDEGAVTGLDAEYINVPVQLESTNLVKLKRRKSLGIFITLKAKDMCEAYANIPFDNDSYKRFFEIIRDGGIPILFNCSFGKDRTGVAAALILWLLGAEKEEIIGDYLRTLTELEETRKLMDDRLPKLFRKLILKKMEAVLTVKREYLEAAISAVEKRYSTIENYFMQEMGYSVSDIERLRAECTESNNCIEEI